MKKLLTFLKDPQHDDIFHMSFEENVDGYQGESRLGLAVAIVALFAVGLVLAYGVMSV
jgi:hypothetical protein